MNIGTNLEGTLKKQSVVVDWNLVAQGLKEATAGGKTRLTEDEAKAVLSDMQKEVQEQQAAKAKEAGEKNKKDGEEFLAANKGKEGVTTLPDGLQYKVLTPVPDRSPRRPTRSCVITRDADRRQGIDSSFSAATGHVWCRPGHQRWTEALQLMPVGSKWQLSFRRTLVTVNEVRAATSVPIRLWFLKSNCSRSWTKCRQGKTRRKTSQREEAVNKSFVRWSAGRPARRSSE